MDTLRNWELAAEDYFAAVSLAAALFCFYWPSWHMVALAVFSFLIGLAILENRDPSGPRRKLQ